MKRQDQNDLPRVHKKTSFYICLILGVLDIFTSVQNLLYGNLEQYETWWYSLIRAAFFLGIAFLLWRRNKNEAAAYAEAVVEQDKDQAAIKPQAQERPELTAEKIEEVKLNTVRNSQQVSFCENEDSHKDTDEHEEMSSIFLLSGDAEQYIDKDLFSYGETEKYEAKSSDFLLSADTEEYLDKDLSAYDEMLLECIRIVQRNKTASVTLLQREAKLGYSRASRIMDQMEELGIVGPYNGDTDREVLTYKTVKNVKTPKSNDQEEYLQMLADIPQPATMISEDLRTAANPYRGLSYKEKLNYQLYTLELTDNKSDEFQALLRELKIKKSLGEGSVEIEMREKDAVFSFTIDGDFVGNASEADNEWINANFSSIITIDTFNVYGGASDKNGCLRPFILTITIKVKHDAELPRAPRTQLPPCALKRGRVSGDTVVLLSASKKIHEIGGCGINIHACTPMLYEEAEAMGGTQCGNCFR